MDILGIGLPELLLILLIALIVFGPRDMVKAGRTMGAWLRRLITSPGWQTFRQGTNELRKLPYTLMREAGLEEAEIRELQEGIPTREKLRRDLSLDKIERDLSAWTADVKEHTRIETPKAEGALSPWTTPPATIQTPEEPLIRPPSAEPEDLMEEPSAEQTPAEAEPKTIQGDD